jgi:nucleoside-diphosphate-sugar epimerase
MEERILLVGGGDLGLRVARRLLDAPAEPVASVGSVASVAPVAPVPPDIWALRRHPPAAQAGSGDAAARVRWVAADVTRPETLDHLPDGLTRVVVALSPGARTPEAYRAVFVQGLQHLVQRLDRRALRRLVFVSSSAVYGEHNGDWVDEATEPAPLGMNGAVLWEAEQWLHRQGLPCTVLRLSGLYGPGRLQLMDRLRAGQARVPRDQVHWANRMHADDAASAIAHLLLLPDAQSVYVGSDDTPLPIDVLYDYLAQRIGCPPPAAGPAPAGVGSKRLCNARLRASGYTPAWPDARAGYAALLAQTA